MKLEIKQLRVTGLDYTDMKCEKCMQGTSVEGSDRCSLCAADTYLNPNTGECVKCPEGTYSSAGSIGTYAYSVCKSMRNCTEDEIPKLSSNQCYKNATG